MKGNHNLPYENEREYFGEMKSDYTNDLDIMTENLDELTPKLRKAISRLGNAAEKIVDNFMYVDAKGVSDMK